MMEDIQNFDEELKRALELKQESDSIMNRIHSGAIEKIIDLMEHFDVTLDELGTAMKGEKCWRSGAGEGDAPAPEKKKIIVRQKYMSHDGQFTWTGRGKMPKWMAKELAAGHQKEEFLIKREEDAAERKAE